MAVEGGDSHSVDSRYILRDQPKKKIAHAELETTDDVAFFMASSLFLVCEEKKWKSSSIESL